MAEAVRWLALAGALAIPQQAAADEPWLLDVEATVGAPITEPQRDWYGIGGALSLGVGRSLAPWIQLEGRLRTGLFLDGDQPSNVGVRDPGNATLNSATLGVLLRLPDGSVRRATGGWLSAGLGGAVTGKDVRATWEAGLGWGFGIGERLALGPVLRFVQVIQPDENAIEPRDARILLGGLKLSLLDAREPPPAPPPPSDRDGDGLLDAQDRCPDDPEDRDGFEDEDGCPDPDNDGDGLLDASDGCPNEAEDKDSFQDEDGCPDPDNDGDRILDVDDQCPLEPETVNGERDDDGCPDEGLIVMRDDRVVLEERVLFDLNSPRVKRSAEPVLRAIIKLHSQHPEWSKMRVEGHADARGDATFNQALSEKRAKNVRASLIEYGMNGDQLESEGFGATRLLTTDNTDEAHARNRRVEFVVISRAPEGGERAPATGGTAPAPTANPSVARPAAAPAAPSSAPAPAQRSTAPTGRAAPTAQPAPGTAQPGAVTPAAPARAAPQSQPAPAPSGAPAEQKP
jgi:outer membrane protein OmpA-like peptidoglycan-associated protein